MAADLHDTLEQHLAGARMSTGRCGLALLASLGALAVHAGQGVPGEVVSDDVRGGRRLDFTWKDGQVVSKRLYR